MVANIRIVFFRELFFMNLLYNSHCSRLQYFLAYKSRFKNCPWNWSLFLIVDCLDVIILEIDDFYPLSFELQCLKLTIHCFGS